MKNKILSLLGFAAKSGNLSFGFDTTVSSLKASKSKLVVISGEISPKSKKEILFFSQKASVKCISLDEIDIETLSRAVGKKCGIISINDFGFAEAFLKAYLGGGNANDQ